MVATRTRRTATADGRSPAGPKRTLSPIAFLGGGVGRLPPAEQRIADYLLERPEAAALATISELAAQSDASPATIVRLARRMGFDGYRDFRIALATEVGRAQGREAPLTGIEIEPSDDLEVLVGKVAAADVAAIRNTIDGLDMAAFSAAVVALSGSRRSLLIGVGAAGLVARDLHDKLFRLRRDVVAATERHAALTGAAMLTARDVALGISHSGETEDVVAPMAVAGEMGATTIALTNYPDSRLARQARIVITTAVADSAVRSRGTASRAAMLTLIDCIFIAVVQASYDQSMHALEVTNRVVERGTARRPES